jgi:hypothetical protein
VVPIPVFVDHLSEEPSALADITNVTSHPTVPAISVTKPPAPLPVDLPDVASLPSPPDSQRSSVDVDLEAGRGVGMQQLPDDDIVIGKSPAQPLTPVTRSVEARITDVSLVDDAIASHPVAEEVTDLLADSIPLEAVPPSLSPRLQNLNQSQLLRKQLNLESRAYLHNPLKKVA